MPFPIPANETERLAALRSYGILDTPAEPEFDELATLAAEICGTPVAAITLVDEARQWFKASVGLSARETSRDISFCARVVASGERDLCVIPDAEADSIFSELSTLNGIPRIRFYAGAPLVNAEGCSLGSLCVVDHQPRKLSARQLDALRILRRHVVNALELRRLAAAQRQTIATLEVTQVDLERARRAAEAADRAKSQFLAAMSHEIRTPMNSVIGMATLLRSTSLNPEQQEYTDILRTSGELLLTVINDILDFSKIESGRLELERTPFRPADCVASAVALVAEAAKRKNLSLVTDIAPAVPAAVAGDSTRLRQILINLLSNAIKFTPQGGVTLSVTHRVRPDGMGELQFTVRDTGIGIPSDRRDRLFQPFAQADLSTTRLYGGTGLGLSISRRLAELHGGRMWFESEPDRGTTFFFTVAVGVTDEPVARSGPAVFDPAFAQKHPLRIILAEDNVVNQRVAVRTLEKLGYAPVVASHGGEVLDLLRRQPFDFVLMDIEMPVMNGLDATRAIRAEFPAARQPAIVALTAHVITHEREQFISAGMDNILTKPIRLDALTALLAHPPARRG